MLNKEYLQEMLKYDSELLSNTSNIALLYMNNILKMIYNLKNPESNFNTLINLIAQISDLNERHKETLLNPIICWQLKTFHKKIGRIDELYKSTYFNILEVELSKHKLNLHTKLLLNGNGNIYVRGQIVFPLKMFDLYILFPKKYYGTELKWKVNNAILEIASENNRLFILDLKTNLIIEKIDKNIGMRLMQKLGGIVFNAPLIELQEYAKVNNNESDIVYKKLSDNLNNESELTVKILSKYVKHIGYFDFKNHIPGIIKLDAMVHENDIKRYKSNFILKPIILDRFYRYLEVYELAYPGIIFHSSSENHIHEFANTIIDYQTSKVLEQSDKKNNNLRENYILIKREINRTEIGKMFWSSISLIFESAYENKRTVFAKNKSSKINCLYERKLYEDPWSEIDQICFENRYISSVYKNNIQTTFEGSSVNKIYDYAMNSYLRKHYNKCIKLIILCISRGCENNEKYWYLLAFALRGLNYNKYFTKIIFDNCREKNILNIINNKTCLYE